MQLLKEYNFYAAIDPGFEGAIGVMNRDGTTVKVWDMPNTPGEGKQREMDLAGLRSILVGLKRFPGVVLGIEWPRTWPGTFGDVAGHAERFGRGKGILEAFAFLLGFEYLKIDPLAWKQRLGLPGKTDPEAIPKAAALWDSIYPACVGLVRGPRGGIKDGRLDALLIAHYLRDQRPITPAVRRYGKDSPEAAAAILGWGGTRRSHRLRIR
jgi:hypothetical protein